MTTTIENGIHPVVRREEYDRIERVNFSRLKAMGRSPAHYQHGLVAPPEDTDAKKLGRVVHVAAFEPHRFQQAIAVWDGGTRRGKDWDAFRRQHEGRELLTLNEYEKCVAIQRAVRADKTASDFTSKGRGEATLLWTGTVNGRPIECKGRIDFDAQSAIVDLKTTRDASIEGFGRQAFSLNYHSQAAWYVDGYALATGTVKPYVIVAVESEPPHVVQVYRVPDHYLELGRTAYQGWLDKLAWCSEQNYWPAYSDGSELELTLPKWATPLDDDDVTGLGLEFAD